MVHVVITTPMYIEKIHQIVSEIDIGTTSPNPVVIFKEAGSKNVAFEA